MSYGSFPRKSYVPASVEEIEESTFLDAQLTYVAFGRRSRFTIVRKCAFCKC